MPPSPINPFEYCTILISIILGLGITQLLSALSELLYHFKKVSFYWPQLCWVVFVLFLHIQDWFITYQLKDKPAWHFGELLFILLYPVALFMVAKLLLPTNDKEESRDMKSYYMSQYPVLFIVMGMTIVLAILFNSWLLSEDVGQQVHLFVFLIAMLLIAFFKIKHPLVHKLTAIAVIAAAIISLYTQAENWVIK